MLTDPKVRNAAAKDRDYKLPDSGGLHLYVTKTGHRSWRFKYRFGGKERRLVFGSYPDVRAFSGRPESRGDSHGRADLIHSAGWMEAGMDGQAVVDGSAVASAGRG